jgi:hypothetical protein
MTTIFRKNFSRRQVDCAEYSGDLVFEECNLTQEVPDTGQGSIFINTDNLTSLTCLNSNCTNHRQPPVGGVVYDGCNVAQYDFSAEKVIGFNIGIRETVLDEVKKVWRWILQWVPANPDATYQDFKDAFIANQGSTIFFADTFLTAMRDGIQTEFPAVTDWATVRDWIINNTDAIDIRKVI